MYSVGSLQTPPLGWRAEYSAPFKCTTMLHSVSGAKPTGWHSSLLVEIHTRRGILVARCSRVLTWGPRGHEYVRSLGQQICPHTLNRKSFRSGWADSKGTMYKAPALITSPSSCHVSATLSTLRSERFSVFRGLHRHEILLVLP